MHILKFSSTATPYPLQVPDPVKYPPKNYAFAQYALASTMSTLGTMLPFPKNTQTCPMADYGTVRIALSICAVNSQPEDIGWVQLKFLKLGVDNFEYRPNVNYNIRQVTKFTVMAPFRSSKWMAESTRCA